MAKYIVVHPVGKGMDKEAATPFAKALKAKHTIDAYWVTSWYLAEEGKLYCEFDAKDVESIKKNLAKAAEETMEMPVEGIYKIEMKINSEDYR